VQQLRDVQQLRETVAVIVIDANGNET